MSCLSDSSLNVQGSSSPASVLFDGAHLQAQLVMPFILSQALEAPEDTRQAVHILCTALQHHPSIVNLMLFPTRLLDPDDPGLFPASLWKSCII